ncbi:MAG TPA: PAS domain S-box protein [Coleofasciculaceae cyanobacterium]
MLDLTSFLSPIAFIPHGHCYLWKPGLVWLQGGSDALIAIAYYVISFTLVYFVRKREDLPFEWIFLLFGGFIIACGTTHLMEIWTLWHPNYWLSGSIKLLTAGVSVYTSIALIPLVPLALSLPSPAQLEAANHRLELEITERKQAENALQKAYDQMEIRVVERTAELAKVNEELNLEIAERDRTLLELKRLEASLQQVKAELEQRVIERTEQLSEVNSQLRAEINERQQAYLALRWSEARYRAIVEDQTELITRFQSDGTLSFVNGAYCRYFGLTRQELIGQRYEPIIFEADRCRVNELVNTMNLDNPVVTIENRVVVGGEVRWTQWNNRMIFDQRGSFVEFQSVGRDITQLKQVEEALRESQRFVQKIADTSPVILYVYDLSEKRNIYANREVAELLGYPPEAIQARGAGFLQDILHPEDRARIPERNQRWNTAKDGEILQTELRMQRINGEWCYLQCQETLFARNADGSPQQILGAAVNITAAKQLEEIQRTKEQLQASLQEKEVLLKEIHHRVKNNLQIVYSLLRLQHRRVKDQQASEILLESRNRIKSIALVHEKLYRSEDLSKINLTQYIPSLVASLFSTYETQLDTVALKTEIDPVSLDVDTAIPCGLIINELVSNALKYAFPPDRKGEICVELRAEDQRQVRLIVKDNGIGIPQDFDFAKAESLGLKLVRDFVAQLEGNLRVERNHGTEFRITFPLN